MSKNKFKITKKILAKEENQVDSRLYEIISKNIQIRMLGDDRNDLFKMLLQLQSQLDHQKAIWQKLKEWLEEKIKENEVLIDPYCKEIEQVFIAGGLARLSEIQKQMQELEGEDE